MDVPEFLSLLRFYSACIETEDRHSLTKQRDALHQSLISPWSEEPLFHPAVAEFVFEAHHAGDRAMLGNNGAALAGGTDRFFYGYPIFLDAQGFLSPLFVAEVELDRRGGDRFAIRPSGTGEIQLNHHLFRKQNVTAEELQVIQEELEGNFGSFANRLHATFEAMEEPLPNFTPNQLDPLPEGNVRGDRWINRPILFSLAIS